MLRYIYHGLTFLLRRKTVETVSSLAHSLYTSFCVIMLPDKYTTKHRQNHRRLMVPSLLAPFSCQLVLIIKICALSITPLRLLSLASLAMILSFPLFHFSLLPYGPLVYCVVLKNAKSQLISYHIVLKK